MKSNKLMVSVLWIASVMAGVSLLCACEDDGIESDAKLVEMIVNESPDFNCCYEMSSSKAYYSDDGVNWSENDHGLWNTTPFPDSYLGPDKILINSGKVYINYYFQSVMVTGYFSELYYYYLSVTDKRFQYFLHVPMEKNGNLELISKNTFRCPDLVIKGITANRCAVEWGGHYSRSVMDFVLTEMPEKMYPNQPVVLVSSFIELLNHVYTMMREELGDSVTFKWGNQEVTINIEEEYLKSIEHFNSKFNLSNS